MRLGFAPSNRPHLHSAYEVTVCNQNFITVFFPKEDGVMYFDDEEYWTIDSFVGTNLHQNAAHQIGHILGIKHSDVRG